MSDFDCLSLMCVASVTPSLMAVIYSIILSGLNTLAGGKIKGDAMLSSLTWPDAVSLETMHDKGMESAQKALELENIRTRQTLGDHLFQTTHLTDRETETLGASVGPRSLALGLN